MKTKILENILFFFLLMFFIAAPCSVAWSEMALGIFLVFRLVRVFVRGNETNPFRAIPNVRQLWLPVLCWVVVSILSALFAEYRTITLLKLPKLLLLGLVFILPTILTNENRLRHAVGALLIGAAISSAYGIGYYLNDSSTRLGGFIGSYMSTAGILMIISLIGFAVLFVGRIGGTLRWIIAASLPVILAALYLTNTRSAWLGLLAGLFFLGLFVRRRYLLVPVAMILLLLFAPGRSRITTVSAIDLGHSRNQERLFMWEAGFRIFREKPILGVGLGGMREIYLRYQDPRSKEKAVHLHSVPIQVLASMGIIGFLAWIYLFGSLLRWLVTSRGLMKRGPPISQGVHLGALAVCAGFLTNGLAEWNLGDVEVITVFWSAIGFAVCAAVIAQEEN